MKKIILLLSISIITPLFGQDDTKINVALFGISANNCPDSTGMAVSDIFAAHIFRSKIFLLLDKNQVERIAAREGLTTTQDYDLPVLLKIGKKLSVQKIIAGSVNKIGSTYSLEIRAIDVASASVDVVVSETIKDDSDFESAIKDAAYRVERYYLGYDAISGKFDITVSPSVLFPFGALKDGFIVAPGGTIFASFNSPMDLPVNPIVSLGYYRSLGNRQGVKFIHFIPAELHISKKYSPEKNINIIPSFGCGILSTYMSADPLRNRYDSNYTYEKKWYANPMATIRIESDIFLFNRSYIAVTPFYHFIYDSGNYGHLLGIDIGIKYLF